MCMFDVKITYMYKLWATVVYNTRGETYMHKYILYTMYT